MMIVGWRAQLLKAMFLTRHRETFVLAGTPFPFARYPVGLMHPLADVHAKL